MTSQQIDFIPDHPSQTIDFIPDHVASPNVSRETMGNNLLTKMTNSPLTQGILGAGDALRNTFAGAANLIPGVNIPMAQSGAGTAYKIGNIAGNVGAFMGGGDALDAARAASQGLPLIGKVAQALGSNSFVPSLARRALGSAAYGAATNPNNSLSGALRGAGTSAAIDSLLGVAGKIPQIATYFQPQQHLDNILQNLSGGQTLADVSKSIPAAIKSAYTRQKNAAGKLYDSVFDNIPNSAIYNKIAEPSQPYKSISDSQGFILDPYGAKIPFSEEQESKLPFPWQGQYGDLINNKLFSVPSSLRRLHNNFNDNPTLSNAKDLSSQLGTFIGKIQNSRAPLDVNNLDALISLRTARDALQNDVKSFLQKNYPEVAPKYEEASNYFLDNVVPYRSNYNIYSMASGKKTNIKPNNLANYFSVPDENVSKVLEDLPQSTINNILYTKLGQRSPASSPDRFLNHFASLDQQGLGSYVSDDLNKMVNGLRNRLWAKNALQTATSAALGGKIGGNAGISEALGGAALGAGLGRPIMNYLQYRLPLDQIANVAKQIAPPAAQTARNIFLSNMLNNTGGQ